MVSSDQHQDSSNSNLGSQNEPDFTAHSIAKLLAEKKQKVVFAESCTGGLAAAKMVTVPGISEHFCGSAVTYRSATKLAWLNVSEELIDLHSAESAQVTSAMAIQVLEKTAEADIGCAITGHLGPGVNEHDGVVYVSIARRQADQLITVDNQKHQLTTRCRVERQQESANIMLDCLLAYLTNNDQV